MRQIIGLAMAAIVITVGCAGATSSPSAASVSSGASRQPVAAGSAVATMSPSPGASRTPRPTPSPPPGVTAVYQLGVRPSGILAAGDVIWAEDHAQTNRVVAIDPSTGRIAASINVTRPCDLAATDGRIWVADLDTDLLLWIDAKTRVISGEIGGLPRPCGPQATAGVIWLAVDQGLARIDAKTNRSATTALGGSAFPGAGTPLWAARYETGELLRIDPKSGKVERSVKPPGGTVEGPPIAAGLGSLWFGNTNARRVYRLDPTTAAIRAEIATTAPTRLLVTADSVWLTSFDEGVVERIDPATNEVVYRARLGGNANGITDGFGAVWVADTGRGRLYRIDPAATGIAE